MRLTWETGYEDYADREHFLPRLSELEAIANGTSLSAARSMPDGQLLDFMEQVEELMRYYATVSDLRKLEPCMRLQQALLEECEARNIAGVGFMYLQMEFIRLNALLYRSTHQNRQAAEYYREFCARAEKCFDEMKRAQDLSPEQMLYVGWSCVEGYQEAAQTNDSMMQIEASIRPIYAVIPMLVWLEPYMTNHVGILDKTANMYCNFGGVLFQNNDPKLGTTCFESSATIYQQLDENFGSDFYRARAIWVRGLHGLQEYLVLGNPRVMLACKDEAEEFLATRTPNARDRGIVLGAQGLVVMQQSAAYQQNNRLPEAIRLAENARDFLKKALNLLEDDTDSTEGYAKTVLITIAARVFSTYIGGLDVLGVQYYNSSNAPAAKQCFTEALSLISDTSRYTVSESAAISLRAECSLYLGLLASDDGAIDEVEFYGKQAVDLASTAARNFNNPAMWAILLTACTLMSEINLAMKNKPQAKLYAEQGLESCNILQRIAPDMPQLQMRPLLEKNLKKASRRFF